MLLNISFAILSIWVMALSFLLLKTIRHYNNLVKGAERKNLASILEELLKNHQDAKAKIEKIVHRCENIEKDGKTHIQKIGLTRFNPFSDTGGNQSFVIALLDGENNGIVINSLHSRQSTRWYIKSVEKGKGIDHELSQEEKKAIEQAKKINLPVQSRLARANRK